MEIENEIFFPLLILLIKTGIEKVFLFPGERGSLLEYPVHVLVVAFAGEQQKKMPPGIAMLLWNFIGYSIF